MLEMKLEELLAAKIVERKVAGSIPERVVCFSRLQSRVKDCLQCAFSLLVEIYSLCSGSPNIFFVFYFRNEGLMPKKN